MIDVIDDVVKYENYLTLEIRQIGKRLKNEILDLSSSEYSRLSVRKETLIEARKKFRKIYRNIYNKNYRNSKAKNG